MTTKIRAVALYLPQFHPIPENNEWWGPGFTEWTNVAKATPLFHDHYQPRVPADLGFYDLRLSESRDAQAELASAHGLEGFCYYHYWFNGRRLIERPFLDVLSSGRPGFPVCLCWANETWSRRWLGEERDILMEQTYSAEDDVCHAQWLVEAFGDDRYLRFLGRPLFLVFRPRDLPEPQRTTDTLRERCVKSGLPDPYLVGVDGHSRNLDSRAIGFDDNLNFTPQLGLLPDAFTDSFSKRRLLRNLSFGAFNGNVKLYDYQDAWDLMAAARPSFQHIPSVFVGWDNTPRRGRRGVVIANASPERFARALTQAIDVARTHPSGEQVVFVNAWNEWAEGNHLEPDLRHGRAYLNALKETLDRESAA